MNSMKRKPDSGPSEGMETKRTHLNKEDSG
jgi:hypothetical protein